MQINRGKARLVRRVSALAVGLMLVPMSSGIAAAAVGTITVGAQSPSPVVAGATATFAVTAHNTNLLPHGFAVTSVSGAPGLSVAASGCDFVWGLTTGTLDAVRIATTAATPAGDTTVTLTVTEYVNLFSCGGGVLDTKTITATLHVQGVQSITFAALAGHVYGDGPIALGATASSGLLVGYSAGGQCTVLGSTLSITGVGSCSVTASQAGNANWAPAAPVVTRSFTIAPAGLTITANNRHKNYGDTLSLGDSAFTTTALVPGDSVTTVVLGSAGAAAGASVGDYDIVPSAASGIGLANYTIAYTNGTLSVAKPMLTVTAPSTSKIQGAANPALDPIYSGFVNGQDSSALAVQPTCSTTALLTSPVGSYPTTCSGGVSSNYDFTYVDGSLSVALGSTHHIVISPDPKSIVAGTAQIYAAEAFDEQGNSLGDVTGLTTFTIDGGGTCTVAACGSSGVGSYTVTGTYQGEWRATAALTVTAAPPTDAPTASPTAAASEQVGGATATPVRVATPPVTSSGGDSPSNDSLPLLLMLISLAFGGVGTLAVQVQRNTIRR